MKQKQFGNFLKMQVMNVRSLINNADVYVINTCTVTNTGDKKSRQVIRRAIRKNPDAVICVTGCYAQTSPAEIMAIPGVDIVVGTQDRSKMLGLIDEYRDRTSTD